MSCELLVGTNISNTKETFLSVPVLRKVFLSGNQPIVINIPRFFFASLSILVSFLAQKPYHRPKDPKLKLRQLLYASVQATFYFESPAKYLISKICWTAFCYLSSNVAYLHEKKCWTTHPTMFHSLAKPLEYYEYKQHTFSPHRSKFVRADAPTVPTLPPKTVFM